MYLRWLPCNHKQAEPSNDDNNLIIFNVLSLYKADKSIN